MRILLVEDDSIIGDGLVVALEKQGMTVDWLQDGTLAKDAVHEHNHDVIILDLTLPGMDGLELLQHWRKKKLSTPVLILTARGSIEQRVQGLTLGADDYLPKPFALAELVARVRALQRRSTGQDAMVLCHENVCFDPHKRLVFKDNTPINISPKALVLLEIFLTHGSGILSRSMLEEKMYGWNDEVSSNTIEVHIHHLRAKLGAHFIKTVHGLGYTLGTAPDSTNAIAAPAKK